MIRGSVMYRRRNCHWIDAEARSYLIDRTFAGKRSRRIARRAQIAGAQRHRFGPQPRNR